MKFYKLIVSLVLVFSLFGFPTKDEAQELDIVIPSSLSIEGQIVYYSQLYNADSSIVSKVIHCESEGNINAVGDGGRSYGIAQFQKPTFKNLSSKLGEELDYNSSHDQIKLLSWSLAHGYGNSWTAYRAIMNGGVYSFYSSQLHKSFRVVCK